MAGASMKAIKNRIKSVESTMSITKAMELVAASKLRRAKLQEEAVKPFYRLLGETIGDLIRICGEKNIYISGKNRDTDSDDTLYIVIAGDRGLAGGYNNNLFRMVRDQLKDGDCILPVGKKSVEHYEKSGYPIVTDLFPVTADVSIPDSAEIGDTVCRVFREGKCSRAVVAYTEFVSMLSQEPRMKQLLPLAKDSFVNEEEKTGGTVTDTIYEPSPEAVLNKIIPQYVSGMIYGAVCEAQASEFAARRSSMSAANKNAGEMIDSLTLHYNRARQAQITQEITEIVAGSDV